MPRDDWFRARQIDHAKQAAGEYLEHGRLVSYESVFEDLFPDTGEATPGHSGRSSDDPPGTGDKFTPKRKGKHKSKSNLKAERTGHVSVVELVRRLQRRQKSDRDKVARALVQRASEAVPILVDELKRPMRIVERIVLIRTIAECGAAAQIALSELLAYLESDSEAVVDAAAAALAKVAASTAARMPRDADRALRMQLVTALVRSGQKSAAIAAVLGRFVVARDSEIRSLALAGIQQQGVFAQAVLPQLREAWRKGGRQFQRDVMALIQSIQSAAEEERRTKEARRSGSSRTADWMRSQQKRRKKPR